MNNIYVVEDLAYTRANIISTLEQNHFKIIGSSAIASRAWEQITTHNDVISLVLIDIHLTGEKDGIWLAEKIGLELNIPYIFLTAYDDNITTSAVLKTKPYGYILKPFKKTELVTTIKLALKKHQELQSKTFDKKPLKDYLYIKSGKGSQKINLNQLKYLQSDGNYIYLFLDNQKLMLRSTLSKMLNILPDHKFIRVHQRYVVCIDKVDFVNTKHLRIGEQKIPISKAHSKEVKSIFDDNTK